MKDWLANLRANLEYLWDRYGDAVLFASSGCGLCAEHGRTKLIRNSGWKGDERNGVSRNSTSKVSRPDHTENR